MQPLKATARPRCGSSIGWAPRSLRSMMDSLRCPSATPSWAHRPAPSGPRGAGVSHMRATAPGSAEPHPALGPTERDLDAFELALVRSADARGMPILGVCRGMQMLNVARGGTLIQDLPDEIGSEINHRQEQPGRVPTHAIRVEPG